MAETVTNEPMKPTVTVTAAQQSQAAVGYPMQAPVPPRFMKTNGEPNKKLPANGSRTGATFSRPASTPDRLIIDLYGSSCWDAPELLTDEEVAHAPPVLAARGIDDATWSLWMLRFKEHFQKYKSSDFSEAMCALCCCWPCMCFRNAKLQHGVRDFNEEFNREVFEPRGMYWSTQRSELNVRNGDDSSVSYVVIWASVALTPTEVQSLKAEEHAFFYYPGDGMHYAWPACTRCHEVTFCCGVKSFI